MRSRSASKRSKSPSAEGRFGAPPGPLRPVCSRNCAPPAAVERGVGQTSDLTRVISGCILPRYNPISAASEPMTNPAPFSCTVFEGDRRIATGALPDVARAAKGVVDRGERGTVLVFDDSTSQPIDLDLRGTVEDVLQRVTPTGPDQGARPAPTGSPRRGPGRPRLGVVSREVTLLPRHWAWLGAQRGGASASLRRIVDEARRANAGGDLARQAQDSTYRFSSAMAGNQPGFEEAMRALFAGDADRFQTESQEWPSDVRDHARKLARGAFPDRPVSTAGNENT